MHLLRKIILFLFTGILLCACGSNPVYKILLIHSYEEKYSLYPYINKRIEKSLKKNKVDAELTLFYLDCNEYNAKGEIEQMSRFLDSAQHLAPDLILVNDDQATYSLLESNHPMLKTLPIVFFGVSYPNWGVLSRYNNVTGVWARPDFVKTIRMVEYLMGPGYISYSTDKSYLGKMVDKEVQSQIAGTDIILNTNYRILEGDTTAVVPADTGSTILVPVNIQQMKGHEMLLFLNGTMKDKATILTKRDSPSLQISGMLTGYPVFTTINEGFGVSENKILGGYIAPLDDNIENVIGIVSRILKGESVYKFPIIESSKKYMIDWNELKRWNIPESVIPNDWQIVNIPLAEKYGILFIGAIIFFALLIVFIIGYITWLWKIERRKKLAAQADLRKEQEFRTMAFKSGNIYIWRYDLNHGVLSFDSDFYGALDVEKQKYDSHFLRENIYPEDRKNAEFIFRKYIESGGYRVNFQFRMRFTGETYIWWEFRLYPSIIILDDTRFIMGLCLNIEEFKKKEKELIEARKLAENAALKESFLANMSHEIRTPLNAIMGFSNLLSEAKDFSDEEMRNFVDVINKNCKILLQLINDILEFSRLESGNMAFIMEYCNMEELIEDLYKGKHLLFSEQIRLLKETPGLDFEIYTDRIRLMQVMTNLLNNAIKFTSKGFIKIGYTVCSCVDPANADKKSRELRIYVEDTGKGIAKEEQKIIFSRFYKQDEFAQGTGLGLSICSGIVEKLGGFITLDSEVGKGSIFTVHIPLNNCNYKIKTDGEGDASWLKEDVPGAVTKQLSPDKYTILIAEDNDSNYLLMESVLLGKYNLVRACNGEEAVQLAGKINPDLILMDIKMEKMDGIEATRIIHRLMPDIPVVMQTAHAFDYDRRAAQEAGCSDFVVKPILPMTLKRVVGKYLK